MRALTHPATIIATIALLVALAGTGYASGLISGKQIRNGTITGAKLANTTVVPPQLSPIVPSGLNFWTYRDQTTAIASGSTQTAMAFCPRGAIPNSGGDEIIGLNRPGMIVHMDDLNVSGNGWFVQADNGTTATENVTVTVACAQ